MRSSRILRAIIILFLLCSAAFAQQKPKVRAITAFVKMDPAKMQTIVADALRMLRQVRSNLQKAGYEVETLRIATQPFPDYTRGMTRDQALAFFRDFDQLGAKEDFLPNVGPAMLDDSDDPAAADLLATAMEHATVLHGTVVVAAEDGVQWKSIRAAAHVIKRLGESGPANAGNFNFAAIAMVLPSTPFYPAAYSWGAGHRFAIATESANIVMEAFAGTGADPKIAAQRLRAALEPHLKAIETVALNAEKTTRWTYAGMDVSPAPLREVSIGTAIENFTGAPFGSSGTLTAAAVVTGVLKNLNILLTGYSGLMIPILEDATLSKRWGEGRLTIDDLLAYSSVCGTGLDTIPLPGDVTEEQLAKIIGDMATLAFRLHKPLSARLMPIKGKKAGEKAVFNDPYLVNTTIQPLP
ncbi:MAG: DUF711 family protein [Acidobacteriia bacterium]|nr:DUF711 family protein [Terriglobia bacterium]